ncbi:hypothetical protein MAPG_00501 [Magnaporthiopsis poae ATCC 64411]|uniref:Uncharacterized protein n=1 Tax=Magnaporthiopsis poae (strain ATCC 64411 / 73-15) TaxID=644358 RepID=A0A0C4DL62_MAGP6|nr:hypothetical protein MAPG_00501 [Magnaporthiopsis poae ATCC 64411]
MSSDVREELEALVALLGSSQAVTDCSSVPAPPSPGTADRLPGDFRPSKPIPTPARADRRRPRDTTHPDYWKDCEDVITGGRRFETRNAWITSDDAGEIAPSSRHHLRAVYPPHLPNDPSWMNQAEPEYGRPSSNGIDVQPAVEQNRRRVRDYLDYAGKEQESRQDLFDKLDELEEKLARVRKDTLDLGPNRRKDRVPQPVLHKISALQRKESELNKGHPTLLNLLWNRRAEVQRTLTRFWEKKALDLETKDETKEFEPTFIADPPCAPKAPVPDTGGAQSPPKEPLRGGTHVPDWFRALEKTGCVALGSEGEEKRFVELLNKMWRLEEEVRRKEFQRKQEEQAGGQGIRKTPWDHHFHEPNPGWAHEKQRRRGGWWTCRDDEDAPLAERLCQICRWESPESSTCGSPSRQAVYGRTQKKPPPAKVRPQQQRKPRQRHNSKVSAADYLEELMGHVRAAMAVVAENDKRSVIATMRIERLDANRQLQGDKRGGFPPRSD